MSAGYTSTASTGRREPGRRTISLLSGTTSRALSVEWHAFVRYVPPLFCHSGKGSRMAAPFYAAAARDLEKAGMDRPQAEAVAGAIRAGQGDLATRADLRMLQWVVGINVAISLATLAVVLATAAR